ARAPVFFPSRRRHTSFSRDWSSDVCSSDLTADVPAATVEIADGVFHFDAEAGRYIFSVDYRTQTDTVTEATARLWSEDASNGFRSEERRGGEEWRARRTSGDSRLEEAREAP